jgi:hypothetical protein
MGGLEERKWREMSDLNFFQKSSLIRVDFSAGAGYMCPSQILQNQSIHIIRKTFFTSLFSIPKYFSSISFI